VSPTAIASCLAAGGHHSGRRRSGPGGRYTLEVSSPVGTQAPQAEDYRRFQVRKPESLSASRGTAPQLGRHLAGLEEGAVALETEAGATMRFPLDAIQKANLKFEW